MRVFSAGLAALYVAVGFGQPALAQENEPMSSYVEDHLHDVPLQLQSGAPAAVDMVYLNVGGVVHSADARNGVLRNNQNRLDWSGVPVLGQLAGDRYNERDFDPSYRIGEAYYADHTVWLDLSEEPDDRAYRRIEFLNQDYAYRLMVAPRPDKAATLPKQPPGQQIGEVYRGEHGALLVLVRPFVVTDSLF